MFSPEDVSGVATLVSSLGFNMKDEEIQGLARDILVRFNEDYNIQAAELWGQRYWGSRDPEE